MGPVRILIVDDNLAYAENIADILGLRGCVTRVFENAEDALEAMAPELCVVIADYRLPGMNGVEFVTRILRERPSLRAIVISADVDHGVIAAARALGAEFLSKPVDFVALNSFVDCVSGSV